MVVSELRTIFWIRWFCKSIKHDTCPLCFCLIPPLVDDASSSSSSSSSWSSSYVIIISNLQPTLQWTRWSCDLQRIKLVVLISDQHKTGWSNCFQPPTFATAQEEANILWPSESNLKMTKNSTATHTNNQKYNNPNQTCQTPQRSQKPCSFPSFPRLHFSGDCTRSGSGPKPLQILAFFQWRARCSQVVLAKSLKEKGLSSWWFKTFPKILVNWASLSQEVFFRKWKHHPEVVSASRSSVLMFGTMFSHVLTPIAILEETWNIPGIN